MAAELERVHGFHKVNNVKARELLQPYLSTDGYYLLRPSSDSKGGVLCTICVTNKSKLMNYRLVQDPSTKRFYIHSHTSFPAISLLLGHYQSTAINAEAKTRLLYPVGVPRQDTPTSEETTLSPTRKSISNSNSNRNSSSDNEIQGLHNFLPKSELSAVMSPYVGHSGYYLLRPSATSAGQLTLAVSHTDQVLNFKINCEKGQYFISPKKRFKSVQELITFYHSHGIRSKKAGNSHILLVHPIPVDPAMEKHYQEIREQKVAARQAEPPASTALLPGWSEHWHNGYNKTYYYNGETGQSLWEKPLAPPTQQSPPPVLEKGSSRSSMRDRPLPIVPGGVGGVRRVNGEGSEDSNTIGRRSSLAKKYSRKQMPIPSTPSGSQTLPHRKKSSGISDRELPPLPPKEETPPPKRTMPPLPPKESSDVRGESSAPGIASRPPMPIPGSRSSQDLQQKSIPALPRKEDTRGGMRSPKPIPPLPPSKTVVQNGHPPLPPKADQPMPPLPPKADEPLPVHLQPPQQRPKRKKVIEYEDIVPLRQPSPKAPPKKVPPPLPEKDLEAATSGPPPPPPPPAIGAPPPPPLPPMAPPSPSPAQLPKLRAATMNTPSPQSSPGSSGRPFNAGDLASQRHMLKKRESLPEEGKKEELSGFASLFASAIDTRRKAIEDSDSESDFDDVEDDDDWDD
ncbi:uncharacterized protein LOC135346353 isoform X2 [Halichondria panicea]|uniref:uncharacterized protein LOC135346353 isoform X2 n=1 Tax=Halichondria panicea TaxID=6063 RepID=UPI00312BB960